MNRQANEPSDEDKIRCWANALGSVPANIREGKNHEAGTCLGTLAVTLLDQRDEIGRLHDVLRTAVINLERGSPADAVAAWVRGQMV